MAAWLRITVFQLLRGKEVTEYPALRGDGGGGDVIVIRKGQDGGVREAT